MKSGFVKFFWGNETKHTIDFFFYAIGKKYKKKEIKSTLKIKINLKWNFKIDLDFCDLKWVSWKIPYVVSIIFYYCSCKEKKKELRFGF